MEKIGDYKMMIYDPVDDIKNLSIDEYDEFGLDKNMIDKYIDNNFYYNQNRPIINHIEIAKKCNKICLPSRYDGLDYTPDLYTKTIVDSINTFNSKIFKIIDNHTDDMEYFDQKIKEYLKQVKQLNKYNDKFDKLLTNYNQENKCDKIKLQTFINEKNATILIQINQLKSILFNIQNLEQDYKNNSNYINNKINIICFIGILFMYFFTF